MPTGTAVCDAGGKGNSARTRRTQTIKLPAWGGISCPATTTMIPPNRQNRTSQMATRGVSGVGKRVQRDEAPSRTPHNRPQRRLIPPPTPISPEASQLTEQDVLFSQPAGVVQAALLITSDDDDITDDDDVVPPSRQRQKTPSSRNL
ncbi:hypothetical protein CC86DRAFT_378595 [Ophiobolus disseminans]|uniref:Uncharacterized protein n=1 Tax=Ophiobolus disseminans TaxID=1469910 RepID=A0A6A7AC77_9PLEO|nr:hypothetical protein CC86DRAFT_378595 [Ophiobolus disseminans]